MSFLTIEIILDLYQCLVRIESSNALLLFVIFIDPDHGYFAHSSSGSMALAFDWYASDGVENTINIHEDFTST